MDFRVLIVKKNSTPRLKIAQSKDLTAGSFLPSLFQEKKKALQKLADNITIKGLPFGEQGYRQTDQQKILFCPTDH